MKRILSAFMCAALIAVSLFAFAGCSKSEQADYKIVMITDGGNVADGAYNQSAWNGVKAFAEEAGVSYRYYQPKVQENEKLSLETAEQYIDLAVKKGAEYIILPSDVFEVAVYDKAPLYNNVKFILVDGTPHPQGDDTDAYIDNVMCISFNSLQSGFLAGYEAVLSGNTKLGYLGSVKSKTSSLYGAGFVQGAQYAADQLGIPVSMDYADYDSPILDYDYTVTLTANYKKLEDFNGDYFIVNVVNGTGSGTYTEGQNVTLTADPAEKGKVFDHWECKSNTEGVKDSKVNLSTKKKPQTNLLVEKCDCTITAVYRDAESETYPVVVKNIDTVSDYYVEYLMSDNSATVTAPSAPSGMEFSHWESTGCTLEDTTQKTVTVTVNEENKGVTLTPIYVNSDVADFRVEVVTGEGGYGQSDGSGWYSADEVVSVSAAVPKEGYIFSHWTNTDQVGYNADVVMANEYYQTTTFTMVNRVQALPEEMYDKGDTLVFAGGCDQENTVAEATKKYSDKKWAFGAQNYQLNWENYLGICVKDYGSAIENCLKDFKGGYTYTGDCANNGIYLAYANADNASDKVDEVANLLASGDIKPISVAPGADVRFVVNSNCFTLNYWIYQ